MIEDDDIVVKDEVEEVAAGVKEKAKVEESDSKVTGGGNDVGGGESGKNEETGRDAAVVESVTTGAVDEKG